MWEDRDITAARNRALASSLRIIDRRKEIVFRRLQRNRAGADPTDGIIDDDVELVVDASRRNGGALEGDFPFKHGLASI